MSTMYHRTGLGMHARRGRLYHAGIVPFLKTRRKKKKNKEGVYKTKSYTQTGFGLKQKTHDRLLRGASSRPETQGCGRRSTNTVCKEFRREPTNIIGAQQLTIGRILRMYCRTRAVLGANNRGAKPPIAELNHATRCMHIRFSTTPNNKHPFSKSP